MSPSVDARSVRSEGMTAVDTVEMDRRSSGQLVHERAATAAARDRRRQFVVTSHLAGMTYREIHGAMRRLNPPIYASVATIGNDMAWARAEWRRQAGAAYQDIVDRENAKLDMLEQGIGRRAAQGDVVAIDRMLKIARQRERLLGLNAIERERADLDERRVRVSEVQTAAMVAVIDGVLAEHGIDTSEQSVAGSVAARLRAIDV